jgi:hypothetical protein
MVLSLFVTATGTARFAVAMGYDAKVGYAVGAIFDIAKGVLPIALLAFLARRALGTAALLGAAWICLVVFSCLATHATVSTAISSIERTGTWTMEVRGNAKAELAAVEQQLAALSRPMPPRPAKTVREAVVGERVPSGIWRDSQECGSIQESLHFAKACAQVVQLRRELAAAQDYERLAALAAELRKGLAEAPIVATSDPLPAAFNATLGRFVPIGGTEGVALLLTVVVELMSSFGLAGLALLYSARDHECARTSSLVAERDDAVPPRCEVPQLLPDASPPVLPGSSIQANSSAASKPIGRRREERLKAPSNVLPLTRRASSLSGGQGGSLPSQGGRASGLSLVGSHVRAFVQARLIKTEGVSLAASELRAAYEAWCAARDHAPLSPQRFAAELKALGYDKWKSYGLMRYRDLQLVA